MKILAAADYQPAILALFDRSAAALRALLPQARVEHVGASSIPGASSKGDLDIAVIVAPEAHAQVVSRLGEAGFQIKTDTLRTPALCRSAPSAVNSPRLARGTHLAVEGYDVVSYIESGKAAKGKPEFQSAYRGVNYRFASDESRRRFAQNPEKYLPTYGGWCASAMGDKGTKVEIDPTNFKVKDGRLFLFYKSLFGDALRDWNKHEKEWEPAADLNWKKLTNEDPVKPGHE